MCVTFFRLLRDTKNRPQTAVSALHAVRLLLLHQRVDDMGYLGSGALDVIMTWMAHGNYSLRAACVV